jgi:hypothetical protein
MKKILVFALLGSLLLSATPASAAIKVGGSCKKIGDIKSLNSTKLACTKVGKKLVWKSISKPITAIAKPTSFANLEANYKGITDSVWTDASKYLSQNLNEDIKVTVEKGPNTKILYANSEIEYGVTRALKLGSNFPRQNKFLVVAFNFQDRGWAKSRLATIESPFTLNDTFADQVSVACSSETECDSAFGNISLDSGLITQAVSGLNNASNTNSRVIRSHYAHETTHTIQKSIYKKYGLKRFSIPCWFSEGQPQAVATSANSESLSQYILNRQSWLRPPLRGLPDFSEASINKFFDLQHNQPCDSATRMHIYDIGFIAVEALVSIGGISSTFEVLDKYASGMTFDVAFEKVYGITWANAKPILARVVSKQYIEANY